jgi:hypothetical protein
MMFVKILPYPSLPGLEVQQGLKVSPMCCSPNMYLIPELRLSNERRAFKKNYRVLYGPSEVLATWT